MRKLKVLFPFLIFILSNISVFSQKGNLPYVDQKFIHFGFSLGLNTMDFGLTQSRDSLVVGNTKKVYSVGVEALKPGFSVGIISDMRLSRYLNLRFTPTLHFADRQLSFLAPNFKDSMSITSIPICLPIYLKYSAERKGNYRPYLIWGAGFYYDLGRKVTEDLVLLKPVDFYTEFGVGCDIYFSFFKLAPELKFALGFNDLLTPVAQRKGGTITDANSFYTLAISKLTSRMLTLTFNFE
jgi:hypothetical protein